MSKTKNYIGPDINEVPEGWVLRPLGDCIQKSGQYGINGSAIEFEKGFPRYLRITDIDENGNLKKIGKKTVDADNYDKYRLEKGDIVFARTGGTVGKTYLYKPNDGDLVFAGYLIRFKPDPEILLPEYLKYYCDSIYYDKWINAISQRSGQPGVNSTELKKLPIILPSIEKQAEIVSILNKWDHLITKGKKLIRRKRLFRKGIVQQFLSGDKKFPQFKNMSWNEYQLGDLVERVRRKVKKPNEKYLSIGIQSHCKGTFQKPAKDPNGNSMEHLYRVKKDDLIVNITFAWEGAIAIVSDKDNGGLVSHRFPTYEFDRNKLLPSFFEYYIKQPRFIYKLGTISPGGAGRNRVLNKSDFLKLKIEVPKIEEQKRISEFLKQIDKSLSLQIKHLKALKKEKKCILQKLLSGKDRLKDVTEVA